VGKLFAAMRGDLEVPIKVQWREGFFFPWGRRLSFKVWPRGSCNLRLGNGEGHSPIFSTGNLV